MKMMSPSLLVLSVLLMTLSFARADDGPPVVHLRHYGDDLHAVTMALKVATMLEDCTIFVDLEGVRLADKRAPNDLSWGQSDQTIGQLLATFVDGGGNVKVCPHCAKAAGLEEASLREGCTLLSGEELATLLAEASKVIDY